MSNTRTEYFPMMGGEDRITPPLSVSAGRLLLSENYDPVFNGGYRRLDGYERFDGQPAPSAMRAARYTLRCLQGTYSVGEPTDPPMALDPDLQAVTGSSSGSQAHVHQLNNRWFESEPNTWQTEVEAYFVNHTGDFVSAGTPSAALTLETRDNLLTAPRDFNDPAWIKLGSPIMARDLTGHDGAANTAWTITDDDNGAHEGLRQIVTFAPLTEESYIKCRVFIKKDPSYGFNTAPGVQVVISASGADERRGAYGMSMWTDASEGRPVQRSTTDPSSSAAVKDYNVDWWEIEFQVTAPVGHDTARIDFFPAATSGNASPTWSVAASNTAGFDDASLVIIPRRSVAERDLGDAAWVPLNNIQSWAAGSGDFGPDGSNAWYTRDNVSWALGTVHQDVTIPAGTARVEASMFVKKLSNQFHGLSLTAGALRSDWVITNATGAYIPRTDQTNTAGATLVVEEYHHHWKYTVGLPVSGETSARILWAPAVNSDPPTGSWSNSATNSQGVIVDQFEVDTIAVAAATGSTLHDQIDLTTDGGDCVFEIVAITSYPSQVVVPTETNASFIDNVQRAADYWRPYILPVPGVGPVRGVMEFADDVFAVRDQNDDIARIYKATFSGWELVDLGSYIQFSGGTDQIYRNDVITNGSGASATAHAVVVTSGAWSSDDAAGRIYITDPAGSWSPGQQIKVEGADRADFDEQTLLTLPAGGKYETVQFNFFADAAGDRLYGVNGVGPAFSFDGTTYCEILTGTDPETPTHVAHHRNHLVLSFGASMINSSINGPYEFDAITGAGEIAVGETITALVPMVEILGVFARNSIHLLYGSDAGTFELKRLSLNTGALAWTTQYMGQPYFLDDRGVTALSQSDLFGNFVDTPISTDVEPVLRPKQNTAVTSTVIRGKNLYRLFFADGTGLTFGFRENRLVGITQFRLHADHLAYTAETFEFSDGSERAFIGCEDGYVREMEKGNPFVHSFDGEQIVAYLRTVFNHNKSPRQRKRYRRVVFEMDAIADTATILFTADFSYGDPNIGVVGTDQIGVPGSGGFWGVDNWSQFVWSRQSTSEPKMEIHGTGRNVSFLINSTGLEPPHTLQGAIVHYTPRRLER